MFAGSRIWDTIFGELKACVHGISVLFCIPSVDSLQASHYTPKERTSEEITPPCGRTNVAELIHTSLTNTAAGSYSFARSFEFTWARALDGCLLQLSAHFMFPSCPRKAGLTTPDVTDTGKGVFLLRRPSTIVIDHLCKTYMTGLKCLRCEPSPPSPWYGRPMLRD